MRTVPALSVEAVLAGMNACGIPVVRLRKRFRLASSYVDPSESLPYSLWSDLWRAAMEWDTRPELPTLVALQIPYGLFGTIDYLAGSSKTVGEGLEALIAHFSAVASGTVLEMTPSRSGSRTVSFRIVNLAPGSWISDEFTTSIILGRFKEVTNGQFLPLRIFLTGPTLAESPHVGLLGAPVAYGLPHAGFDLAPGMLRLLQPSSNPGLRVTLSELAKKLGFGDGKEGALEVSVRARLHDSLPQGRVCAAQIAPSIGVSERTLHRRLAAAGTSFQELLDRFRVEEARRLLLEQKLPLVEIAQRLGYGDQASWSRAFKRIHGVSPKAWKIENS